VRGMNFIHSLIDKRVDGVLIMSSSVSELWIDELRKNNVPVVISDWKPDYEASGMGVIDVDFETGIEDAVNHLIGLGHTRFAHVSGPLELRTARNRRDLFLQALSKHGIPAEEVSIAEGNLQIDGGRRAMEYILNLSVRPTAIFSANDLMAIGMITEARMAGLQVPNDLSIVGLDNIWLSDQIEPPLTTVALPRNKIGQTGMEMLFELMAASDKEDTSMIRRQVHSSLVARKSSGPAPG
ncbi:MAG: substrate-binding domain-containing protein, partial [Chloroflexota bacterium]